MQLNTTTCKVRRISFQLPTSQIHWGHYQWLKKQRTM